MMRQRQYSISLQICFKKQWKQNSIVCQFPHVKDSPLSIQVLNLHLNMNEKLMLAWRKEESTVLTENRYSQISPSNQFQLNIYLSNVTLKFPHYFWFVEPMAIVWSHCCWRIMEKYLNEDKQFAFWNLTIR